MSVATFGSGNTSFQVGIVHLQEENINSSLSVMIFHTQYQVLARVLLFYYLILVDLFYSSLDYAVGT